MRKPIGTGVLPTDIFGVTKTKYCNEPEVRQLESDYAKLEARLWEAVELLNNATNEIWKNTCSHEETHRGGILWEICDMCGCKWADDEGGKPEFKEPEVITKIDNFLSKIDQEKEKSDV